MGAEARECWWLLNERAACLAASASPCFICAPAPRLWLPGCLKWETATPGKSHFSIKPRDVETKTTHTSYLFAEALPGSASVLQWMCDLPLRSGIYVQQYYLSTDILLLHLDGNVQHCCRLVRALCYLLGGILLHQHKTTSIKPVHQLTPAGLRPHFPPLLSLNLSATTTNPSSSIFTHTSTNPSFSLKCPSPSSSGLST